MLKWEDKLTPEERKAYKLPLRHHFDKYACKTTA